MFKEKMTSYFKFRINKFREREEGLISNETLYHAAD